MRVSSLFSWYKISVHSAARSQRPQFWSILGSKQHVEGLNLKFRGIIGDAGERDVEALLLLGHLRLRLLQPATTPHVKTARFRA